MGHAEQRTCLNCGERFTPDRRNRRHQRYCSAPACKAASKRASQARWLALPENHDYHCGPQAVARVQAWRAAHPGYSQHPRKPAPSPAEIPAIPAEAADTVLSQVTRPNALLSPSAAIPEKRSCNARDLSPGTPLQDFLSAQPIVLVGLIAHLWGSALQEDIVSAVSRLIELGQDIQGGRHEYGEAALEPRTPAPDAGAFQLARPPPGAGALHRTG